MTNAFVKFRKVEGSIVISIPKKVAEHKGIREGKLLEIDVKKSRKDWFGAFRGIGSFKRGDELDTHE